MDFTGFDNEKQLLAALNVTGDYLNINIRNIIYSIYPNINLNERVICAKAPNGSKADLILTLNNEKIGISIKKGSGNSVHQEPVQDFIKFLSNELGASISVCKDILFYIWGDGTLDGTGNPDNRVSGPDIKKNYLTKLKNIQNFFDENRKELLNRALKYGSKTTYTPADYIYYGVEENGFVIKTDVAIDYLISKKSFPGVGGLTFQAWNRNLNNNNNSTEKKRGVIQFKWGSLRNDIVEILNALW